MGNKGDSNTTALMKANKRAQFKRPYLELLGSEGKRERDSVRQRETRGKEIHIICIDVKYRQPEKTKNTLKVRGKERDVISTLNQVTMGKLYWYVNFTSPSSSSTSKKSKSLKTLNCCSLAVSSRVSSLVPPSSDETPLSLTSIMSRSPHDEKITLREETKKKGQLVKTCVFLHKYMKKLDLATVE